MKDKPRFPVNLLGIMILVYLLMIFIRALVLSF